MARNKNNGCGWRKELAGERKGDRNENWYILSLDDARLQSYFSNNTLARDVRAPFKTANHLNLFRFSIVCCGHMKIEPHTNRFKLINI